MNADKGHAFRRRILALVGALFIFGATLGPVASGFGGHAGASIGPCKNCYWGPQH